MGWTIKLALRVSFRREVKMLDRVALSEDLVRIAHALEECHPEECQGHCGASFESCSELEAEMTSKYEMGFGEEGFAAQGGSWLLMIVGRPGDRPASCEQLKQRLLLDGMEVARRLE